MMTVYRQNGASKVLVLIGKDLLLKDSPFQAFHSDADFQVSINT